QLTKTHAAEGEPVFSSKCLKPFNRLAALGIMPLVPRRLERVQNNILSVLKRSRLKPLTNESIEFRSSDVDRHARSLSPGSYAETPCHAGKSAALRTAAHQAAILLGVTRQFST